jgi:hypothetical protein
MGRAKKPSDKLAPPDGGPVVLRRSPRKRTTINYAEHAAEGSDWEEATPKKSNRVVHPIQAKTSRAETSILEHEKEEGAKDTNNDNETIGDMTQTIVHEQPERQQKGVKHVKTELEAAETTTARNPPQTSDKTRPVPSTSAKRSRVPDHVLEHGNDGEEIRKRE